MSLDTYAIAQRVRRHIKAPFSMWPWRERAHEEDDGEDELPGDPSALGLFVAARRDASSARAIPARLGVEDVADVVDDLGSRASTVVARVPRLSTSEEPPWILELSESEVPPRGGHHLELGVYRLSRFPTHLSSRDLSKGATEEGVSDQRSRATERLTSKIPSSVWPRR